MSLQNLTLIIHSVRSQVRLAGRTCGSLKKFIDHAIIGGIDTTSSSGSTSSIMDR
jgi:hypothetical protein